VVEVGACQLLRAVDAEGRRLFRPSVQPFLDLSGSFLRPGERMAVRASWTPPLIVGPTVTEVRSIQSFDVSCHAWSWVGALPPSDPD